MRSLICGLVVCRVLGHDWTPWRYILDALSVRRCRRCRAKDWA